MCQIHITQWEIHAAALMLCRMAFYFSGKLIALYLDNFAVKVY